MRTLTRDLRRAWRKPLGRFAILAIATGLIAFATVPVLPFHVLPFLPLLALRPDLRQAVKTARQGVAR